MFSLKNNPLSHSTSILADRDLKDIKKYYGNKLKFEDNKTKIFDDLDVSGSFSSAFGEITQGTTNFANDISNIGNIVSSGFMDATEVFYNGENIRDHLYSNDIEFGFIADGLTDISTQFQNAITNSKVISFRNDRTYILKNTIVIQNISNLTIKGNGCIFKNDGQIGKFFDLKGTLSNIKFENFNIVSTNPGSTSGGIIDSNNTNNMNNIFFDNVNVHTTHNSAISFNNLNNNNEAQSGRITNFHFINGILKSEDSNSYGLLLRKHCSKCMIKNSHFILNNKDGSNKLQSFNNLALYGGCEYFNVSGCYFEGGGHSPLACSPARFGTISNNVVNMGNASNQNPSIEGGIEVEFKQGHGSTTPSHDITITGNHVYGYIWGIMLRRYGTNTIDRPYNITITGNSISNPLVSGIRVDAKENITIVGNTIYCNATTSANCMSVTSGIGIIIANNIMDCPVLPFGSTLNFDASESGTSNSNINNILIKNNYIRGISNNSGRSLINMRDHSGRITDNFLLKGGHTGSNDYISSSGNVIAYGNYTDDNTNDYQMQFGEDVNFAVKSNGNIQIGGTLNSYKVVDTSSTTSYNVQNTDNIILCADDGNAALTLNLPEVNTDNDGKIIEIKEVSANSPNNNIEISSNGSQSIDGSTDPLTINTTYGKYKLMAIVDSSYTGWIILNE